MITGRRIPGIWAIALLALPLLAGESQDQGIPRKTRVKLGSVVVGGGYTYSSGYPYYPYAWRGPYPWDPFWWPSYPWYGVPFHPGYWGGYTPGAAMGEVRLTTSDAAAQVLLDGAFAGLAKDRKSMWLEPGAYDLEVRGAAGGSFRKRIYVLSGKTLKVRADVGRPEEKEVKP